MSISPLRQRMIGDMTARHIGEKTQKNYIRCVRSLTLFIGRPPETATAEDLRAYRVHLVESPLGASSVNAYMTALRFFFGITLDRTDLLKCLFHVL
jgi:integrase/recombinase XerD